ncbi:MAG TPA: energy transducer TonB [Caulobacteraceae bacterium]|jgi:protein TonB|nr:energy transducer TonB [Caulobacteraceae bacterium]
MMMQAAGAGGGVLQNLNESGGRRRIPPWLWVALGISLTVHIAGLAWLFNQHWKAPPALPDTQPPVIVTFWRPPVPPPPPQPTKTLPKSNPIKFHDNPLAPTPDKTIVTVTHPPTDADTKYTISGPSLDPGTGTIDGRGGGGGTAKSPVILNPTWLTKPDAAAMSRFYPTGAIAGGIEGTATLHCIVTVSGTLTNCTVVSETPPRYGFGNAAKHLAPYFRMKPKTVDGAEVTIPIKFSINA